MVGAEVTTDGDAEATGAKTGAASGDVTKAEVAAGGDAREAEALASGDVTETEATFEEAVETMVEADSGSSSSFSYEDSKETVLEMRPEVSLDEVGPAEVPEARPVDPFITQFGEDDS